jgi:rare lipoprotein A
MINRVIAGLFMALASCSQPAGPPPGPVAYTIGQPYQAGGEWHYPREFNAYDVTGLATVYPGGPAYTADNEHYDADALAAANPVLQLPAIVTVTNLVNGYTMQVRVNDRGPMQPGRVLEVTPRVAAALGFPPGGVVEVEVTLDTQKSALIDGALGAGPKLTAAPVAGITAQSLGPPGGVSPGSVQVLGGPQAAGTGPQAVLLTGAVTIGPRAPGALFIQVPGFGSEDDAYRQMIRLYNLPARVAPAFGGDRTLWEVLCGPYHSVTDADAALRQALALGAPDPEIIVR